jgi:hypothetical protein
MPKGAVMLRVRPLVRLALFLALVAAPSFAYTIYLKDGTRLIAREKYTVEGDLAILYQPSGTKSSLPLEQIDVERTEEANVGNLSSTAYVIEGGQATEVKKNSKPAPKKQRIQDLIKADSAGIRADRTAARTGALMPEAAKRPDSAGKAGTGKRGRAPLANVALAGEIRGFVLARGVTGIEIYAGPNPSWPLLVYNTGSEGAVFKALLTGANALLHFQGTRGSEVQGVEIVCETADGGSGGRFSLTPKQASEIVSGRTEITRFYVENVQF